ncbi:uncharacterized protein [Dermacentor andersoni]|uniref:uncharacterized protein isoform X2 n=1 Tax=Dermacentor andersoni TaxID=34620 RepID=UPI002416C2ED|nr:uncharacterized protein LOC126516588 isoform X2 [Dermacentor andersoni]XP_054920005.1 uncharacterized protein LOC126516588 isoform X2 [Dermacentor andersoni]
MSDWSDSTEAADSDTSDIPPRFSRPWDEKAAPKRAKPEDEDSSPWMWYYNLTAKQRRAEDERIANKLAATAAEFREVEEFALTYAPFEYRTRGSSLSPNTPPPRGLRVPASSTVVPASAEASTSKAGLPEPPREAPREPPRKAQPHRRVLFRLADGSVVSSSDDEDTHVSRSSRKRPVCSDDADKHVGSPPTSEGRVDDISSGTDDDAGASGRVAQLSTVRDTSGAWPRSVREEDVDRESGGDAERASSSSLTRADVIRKRRERIERQRSLLEEICSGRLSSGDESSRKRSFRRSSVVTPTDRSVTGRLSSVRRKLLATPSPTSSVEDPLLGLERGQTPPSLNLSSDDSATTSFMRPGARTSRGPLRVWHSTPHGAPRRFVSSRDISTTDSAALLGTLVKAASAERRQRADRRLQALDRGETLVITQLLPELQEGTNFGGQPPTGLPSAAPSPASRRHDESSISRRSVDAAEWSIVMRFGVGSNRERVLLSDALSPLSAIASFGARSRSRASQAPQDPLREQREQAPAAGDYDSGPATLLQQLLRHCQQEAPVTFEVALRLTDDCRRCLKLGEGCTADVYRIRRPSGDESAVKVIPVGGGRNEDGELPMSLSSVILECVMTRELSNLRFNETNQSANFIELKRIYCVQGTYHPVLMKSWNDYDNQFCSENSDPALFQETQHYVLLEFEFGGKTLERSKVTIEQLESVFLQVACSLAVAEPELEFEHRDLHCDNVLVKPTEEEFAEFVLHGRKIRVRTAGVKASVIDYTLSRTRIGGQVYFTDLSKDSAIFQGTGSFQYDIYRIMKEHNGDDWEAFRPHTNVLWLHYLLMKLLHKLPKTKQVTEVIEPSSSRGRLSAWMDVILSFPSAEQFVVEQVLPHLERDAEAPRRAKRAERPQPEPHAMNLRAHR